MQLFGNFSMILQLFNIKFKITKKSRFSAPGTTLIFDDRLNNACKGLSDLDWVHGKGTHLAVYPHHLYRGWEVSTWCSLCTVLLERNHSDSSDLPGC